MSPARPGCKPWDEVPRHSVASERGWNDIRGHERGRGQYAGKGKGMKYTEVVWIAVGVAIGIAACRDAPEIADRTASMKQVAAPAGQENADWIRGSVDDRFRLVAKPLRGFDVAMIETGHRYTELYWAGQDRNWDYARYQIEKIRTAVANGVERRPKRARSAQVLEGILPALEEAVRLRDPVRFQEEFAVLTETCNACHRAEDVGFMTVAPPSPRLSPVQAFPDTTVSGAEGDRH